MYQPAGVNVHIVRALRPIGKPIVLRQIPVDEHDLIGGQLQIHPSHRVHQPRKGLKIHQHVTMDGNVKILFYGFHQKLCAPEGICAVQPVIVITGNLHIDIPQQRRHVYLLCSVADGKQNHGVAAPVLPVFPGIVSYEQNIHHSLLLHGKGCHGFHLPEGHLSIGKAHQLI